MNEITAESKNKLIAGIGQVVACKKAAEMVAYALGSCIALCLCDEEAGVGAMAHILLPAKSDDSGIPDARYANHAVRIAVGKMLGFGADRGRIRAAIIGGAEMFPHGSVCSRKIGEENTFSVTEALWKENIPLVYADTGGRKARTVIFRIPGASFDEQITIR